MNYNPNTRSGHTREYVHGPLSPEDKAFRGIIIGCGISAVFWGALIGIVCFWMG